MGSTIQDWLEGPSDLKEATVEDVPVPGKSVKVRALPAKFSAQVSGQMKVTTERGEQVATVDVPKMELLQFLHGVVEPKFEEDQVRVIQERYGPAFRKVIAQIDELSGVDKEAIEQAQATFPAAQRHANGTAEAVEVPAPPGVADLYFLCELALELGMTLDELGTRETNYNVCVTWPLFFAERARVREIQRIEQEHQQEVARGRM